MATCRFPFRCIVNSIAARYAESFVKADFPGLSSNKLLLYHYSRITDHFLRFPFAPRLSTLNSQLYINISPQIRQRTIRRGEPLTSDIPVFLASRLVSFLPPYIKPPVTDAKQRPGFPASDIKHCFLILPLRDSSFFLLTCA